jgi:hypothetical protein
VTPAVTGYTISGQAFRRQRVPVFQEHRLPLTGSRWNIRWAIGRRTKPTLCVFFCVVPFISLAVIGKCCDACGDGRYYFRSGFSASEGVGVQVASIAVDRKSMGPTLGDRSSNEADFLCISCIWRGGCEKCFDDCGGGENFFRSVFLSVRGCQCLRGIDCP